jgi:hypothetical protein
MLTTCLRATESLHYILQVEARIERLEQQAATVAVAAASDNVGERDVEERLMAIEERCEETTRRLTECVTGVETLKAATAAAAGGEAAGEAAAVEDEASGRGGGKNERRAGAWEALEVRVAAVAVDASEAAAQVRAFRS